MSRELDRPAPPYRQIANDIKGAIRDGWLTPGETVPSVRAITKDYGVAHATAYRAITTLQAEGFVRSVPGMGNVVTSEEERGLTAAARVERSRRTGKIYPPGQYAKITEAELSPAPELAASVYGVKPGDNLVKRARVTYRDERPVSRSVSWFSADLADVAPRLIVPERIVEGTFAYLASVTGRQLGSWQDQYEAANASGREASWLAIEEGCPVFHGRNWVYDRTGDVLEYGESVQGGRVTYRGDLTD